VRCTAYQLAELVRLGFAAKTTRARGASGYAETSANRPRGGGLSAEKRGGQAPVVLGWDKPLTSSRPSSRLSRLGCNLMPEVADLVRPLSGALNGSARRG
jgi:hypothetical protein